MVSPGRTSGWRQKIHYSTCAGADHFGDLRRQLSRSVGLLQECGRTHAEMAYKVQLDVSGSTFGTTFTPTDVTANAAAGMSFEPITVNWGRQDQYTAINPTTVSGELINSDGTFSPGNTSSTYYPHIRRGMRRRVSVGVNGTTVNLSEDYATSLEVVPANNSLAVTKIDGADILAAFGAIGMTSAAALPL